MIPTLAWPTCGNMGNHLYQGTRIFCVLFYRNDLSCEDDPVCVFTWRAICFTEAHVQHSSPGAPEATSEADLCQNSRYERKASSAGDAVLAAPAWFK